jgi:Transposase, Mutator family
MELIERSGGAKVGETHDSDTCESGPPDRQSERLDRRGRKEDGFREILAVAVAHIDSEATSHELFRSLKRRGLSGVELMVSDDHEGLRSAISRHFQGVAYQRCQVHYMRNLLRMVAPHQSARSSGRT